MFHFCCNIWSLVCFHISGMSSKQSLGMRGSVAVSDQVQQTTEFQETLNSLPQAQIAFPKDAEGLQSRAAPVASIGFNCRLLGLGSSVKG